VEVNVFFFALILHVEGGRERDDFFYRKKISLWSG
jgi:hypothetical protein